MALKQYPSWLWGEILYYLYGVQTPKLKILYKKCVRALPSPVAPSQNNKILFGGIWLYIMNTPLNIYTYNLKSQNI